MPVLSNPRWEKFCQGIKRGKNGAQAYRDAGYNTSVKASSVAAYRLLANPLVAERVGELTKGKKGTVAIEQIALAKQVGRPTIYRPEINEIAKRFALLGATDVEMAEALNIALANFYRWQKQYPGFREAIQAGKLNADAEIADSLYHRAKGYSHDAVKIFMPAGAETPVYAPYTEHYAPDTGAAKMWLTNRRPDDWRDRRSVEHAGTVDHRIANMSEPERMSRLQELTLRAAKIIDNDTGEDVEE